IAAVKLSGDEPILRPVLRSIGIEQIEIDPADVQFPNFREHIAAQNPNRYSDVIAVALHFPYRQVMEILIQVYGVLDAVLINFLPKITVAIQQADRDKLQVQ